MIISMRIIIILITDTDVLLSLVIDIIIINFIYDHHFHNDQYHHYHHPMISIPLRRSIIFNIITIIESLLLSVSSTRIIMAAKSSSFSSFTHQLLFHCHGRKGGVMTLVYWFVHLSFYLVVNWFVYMYNSLCNCLSISFFINLFATRIMRKLTWGIPEKRSVQFWLRSWGTNWQGSPAGFPAPPTGLQFV